MTTIVTECIDTFSGKQEKIMLCNVTQHIMA